MQTMPMIKTLLVTPFANLCVKETIGLCLLNRIGDRGAQPNRLEKMDRLNGKMSKGN
jgi:hypothetical protein